MTTAVIEEKKAETPEEAKARRNAEYLAMLDESFKQIKEGKVFVTTIEALEAMTDER
jgi:hypothetical protein